MLPTTITGAVILEPSPAAVHTIVPALISVTRTSPPGVNQSGGGKADRAWQPAAGLARGHGDDAIDADGAVYQFDGGLGALRLNADLEGVAVAVLRENQSPQALESLIEGEPLGGVEVARRQVLVGDDRRIQLGVGLDLRVVGVRAGLLAAGASDRVVIRVAKQRDADGVHDLELELVDRERAAHGAPAASPAHRAAGDREQSDRDGKLELHALMNQTRPPGPQRNALTEPNGPAMRIHLEWPRMVKPIIPGMGARPRW